LAGHGPSCVTGNEVDNPGDGGGEAQDAQFVINENNADSSTSQQCERSSGTATSSLLQRPIKGKHSPDWQWQIDNCQEVLSNFFKQYDFIWKAAHSPSFQRHPLRQYMEIHHVAMKSSAFIQLILFCQCFSVGC